jgi:beta-fructofuranosidase
MASDRELRARADRAVAQAAKKAGRDPQRPRYHLMPAAHWNNDPNGPVQYRGRFHMFYQHNPFEAHWGNMSWGHAFSEDLVHWKHLPIALVPTPGAYDKDGVFSGCCVIDKDVPTIVYTGVRPEVQCLACSRDGLRTWRKHPANPVISTRPEGLDLEGFRDPFVWKEGRNWYMALGSGIKGKGGTVLLYRSPDLVRWKFLKPLCVGKKRQSGHNWECPNFFGLGKQYVLVVSPHGPVLYWTGRYQRHEFAPRTPPQRLDLGDAYYAPNSLQDEKGRRLMWGWVHEARDRRLCEKAGWSGCLTLPRVLSLREDGTLGMEPAPELKALRGRHWRRESAEIRPGEGGYLKEIRGDCLEIRAEFSLERARQCGLKVRRSPGGRQETAILYDRQRRCLEVVRERSSRTRGVALDTVGGRFALKGGERLHLQVFLDRSVLEIYANGRACLTTRVYPSRQDALGLELFARGGKARLHELDIWEMGTIWRKP